MTKQCVGGKWCKQNIWLKPITSAATTQSDGGVVDVAALASRHRVGADLLVDLAAVADGPIPATHSNGRQE